MQIGFVTKEQFEGTSWLKLFIRAPFVRPFELKMSAHKKKDKDSNEPDYDLFFLVNGRNEKFRNFKAGALWFKTSQAGDTYMSGTIESPVFAAGYVNIALVKSKPIFEGEKVSWIYDVLWGVSNAKKEHKEEPTSTGEAHVANDEDIPF